MKHIALILSALILTACGGGGGGGGPVPVAPVASTSLFQIKDAYNGDFFDSSTYGFTVEGTVTSSGLTGTVAGSGTITQTPISNTTFEGVMALQKTKTINGSVNVTVAGTTTTSVLPPTANTTYLSPAFVLDFLGTSTIGVYSVAVPPFVIPVTARVGQSGTFGTVNTYASAAKGPITGTTVVTWALTADTASTAILTVTQSSRNASSALVSTQDEVFRITPTGGTTRLRAVGVVYGTGTLTYNFQ